MGGILGVHGFIPEVGWVLEIASNLHWVSSWVSKLINMIIKKIKCPPKMVGSLPALS
jgi:hypothetical protein